MTDRPSDLPEIRLRAAQQRDAHLLHRWREEESVRRFQPLMDLSISQIRAELAKQQMAELYRDRGDKYQWMVLVAGEPAGWITLVILNWEHGLAEVGYTLTSKYQRRGLMVHAMHLLISDLFDRTSLERIEARCAVENHASQRVLERLGFKKEGTLRSYFRLHGKRVDNLLFAILKVDFPGKFEV